MPEIDEVILSLNYQPRRIEEVCAIPTAIAEALVVGCVALFERSRTGDRVGVVMGPSDMRCVPTVGVSIGEIPAQCVVLVPPHDRDVTVAAESSADLILGEGEVGGLALRSGLGRDPDARLCGDPVLPSDRSWRPTGTRALPP